MARQTKAQIRAERDAFLARFRANKDEMLAHYAERGGAPPPALVQYHQTFIAYIEAEYATVLAPDSKKYPALKAQIRAAMAYELAKQDLNAYSALQDLTSAELDIKIARLRGAGPREIAGHEDSLRRLTTRH